MMHYAAVLHSFMLSHCLTAFHLIAFLQPFRNRYLESTHMVNTMQLQLVVLPSQFDTNPSLQTPLVSDQKSMKDHLGQKHTGCIIFWNHLQLCLSGIRAILQSIFNNKGLQPIATVHRQWLVNKNRKICHRLISAASTRSRDWYSTNQTSELDWWSDFFCTKNHSYAL